VNIIVQVLESFQRANAWCRCRIVPELVSWHVPTQGVLFRAGHSSFISGVTQNVNISSWHIHTNPTSEWSGYCCLGWATTTTMYELFLNFAFHAILRPRPERAHSKATSPHVHQARTQWWSLHSNYESPPWYQHNMSILLQREPTLARRMVGNSRRVLYFRSHWMFKPQEPRPESLTIPPIKLKRN